MSLDYSGNDSNRRDESVGGGQIKLTIKAEAYIALFRERAQKSFFRSCADMSRDAEELGRSQGLYDPNSRHARGLTNFPTVHHVESFRPFSKIDDAGGVKAGFVSTSGRGYWLENGTKNAVARPHMWPAFEARKDQVLKGLEGIMNHD